MIKQIIETEIIIIQGISPEEIDDLIKKHEACHDAKISLMKGNISWDDYIDILAFSNLEIDEFLDEANNDAILMGI